MTDKQFRAWRKRHKLTFTTAAQALGYSRRMIAYFNSGGEPIPLTIELACLGYTAQKRKRAGARPVRRGPLR